MLDSPSSLQIFPSPLKVFLPTVTVEPLFPLHVVRWNLLPCIFFFLISVLKAEVQVPLCTISGPSGKLLYTFVFFFRLVLLSFFSSSRFKVSGNSRPLFFFNGQIDPTTLCWMAFDPFFYRSPCQTCRVRSLEPTPARRVVLDGLFPLPYKGAFLFPLIYCPLNGNAWMLFSLPRVTLPPGARFTAPPLPIEVFFRCLERFFFLPSAP